jgi:saccharopine dehydrogenase-like NADP-dependent oxidoreductase
LKRVLVIGGYGNFGSFISKHLAKEQNLQLIIAGRTISKAQALAEQINAEAAVMDIQHNVLARLQAIKPDIVIHTSGPFQSQGYDVAEACINYGAHYIDLADGREFVSGISALDKKAKQAGVTVVSGASSVPCLTSALIEHYKDEFSVLSTLDYGITTAQKTARGVATTAAILSYTGQPFKTLVNGRLQDIYGWQNLHARKYPGLGWRLLGNCNIPDLEIFPTIYPDLKSVRFYAGLELPFIHVTLWGLSWLVRAGLIKNLSVSAPLLLKLSFLFDWLGSANSGDGPYIPCMPAILVAHKLARGEPIGFGASPCVGIIGKQEYLQALESLDISWSES